MCQGFSHFSVFLHHFVLVKLGTSSLRVDELQIFCEVCCRKSFDNQAVLGTTRIFNTKNCTQTHISGPTMVEYRVAYLPRLYISLVLL